MECAQIYRQPLKIDWKASHKDGICQTHIKLWFWCSKKRWSRWEKQFATYFVATEMDKKVTGSPGCKILESSWSWSSRNIWSVLIWKWGRGKGLKKGAQEVSWILPSKEEHSVQEAYFLKQKSMWRRAIWLGEIYVIAKDWEIQKWITWSDTKLSLEYLTKRCLGACYTILTCHQKMKSTSAMQQNSHSLSLLTFVKKKKLGCMKWK